jgi:hypothetical protein
MNRKSKDLYDSFILSDVLEIEGNILKFCSNLFENDSKMHSCKALRLCTGRTAYRASRGIALPFLDHGTRRDEGKR